MQADKMTTPAPSLTGAIGPRAGTVLPAAIETRRLRKAFGQTRALAGVDLRVPEGSRVAIVGSPGAGKTVLIKHVLGLMLPDSGEVLVRGRSLARMTRSEILRLRKSVGVLFQEGGLFNSMSVRENVSFPLRQHTDLTSDEIATIADERLAAAGLEDAGPSTPGELPQGTRRMVALVRALVLDPELVLCDEPGAGLDPEGAASLSDMLAKHHLRRGGTMVIATRDPAMARRIAESAAVMKEGEIVAEGPVEELLDR